ncbi:hypothetical protein HAX54_051816 [Datura stramonium]|uniref:Uncharacterized protein n=1 Tax=Datura stramonium TaxID=4076 RepID=A0ABS8RRK1_DATST|nr:hypothetical protein [Datura stramonium]
MIEKNKENLRKLRKENDTRELKIMMDKIIEGEVIPTDLHPNDFNNLMYVMNQHLIKMHELEKEWLTKRVPHRMPLNPLLDRWYMGRTNLERPTEEAPVSMTPLVTPLMFSGGTNFERPKSPLFVPDVDPKWLVPTMDPSTVLFSALDNVPQQIFHREAPLRTPPQMVPLVGPLAYSSFFIIFFTNIISNKSTSALTRREHDNPPRMRSINFNLTKRFLITKVIANEVLLRDSIKTSRMQDGTSLHQKPADNKLHLM